MATGIEGYGSIRIKYTCKMTLQYNQDLMPYGCFPSFLKAFPLIPAGTEKAVKFPGMWCEDRVGSEKFHQVRRLCQEVKGVRIKYKGRLEYPEKTPEQG